MEALWHRLQDREATGEARSVQLWDITGYGNRSERSHSPFLR